MNVSRSYWRGVLIVGFTVLASAVVVLAGARSGTVPARAAQDLGDQAEALGAFELVERSGRRSAQQTWRTGSASSRSSSRGVSFPVPGSHR